MALFPPPRHPLPKESDHSNISTLFERLFSDDKGQQYDGLTGIRKLLSMEHNPPIQEIIDTGHVPKILEFLNWDHDPKFQLESAWAITNICSGTSQHVAYMVQIGSLEHIGKLLLSNSAEVVDQAVWAVGNVAGDSTYYRDLCLDQGFMEKFLTTLVRFPSNASIIRNTVWGISNLIRGKPMPPYEKVGAALPYLAQAIATFHYDIDIVTDALWGISYLSELNAQMIINVGLIPGLVVYLGHNTPTLITPALRALGNIVTGDDHQTSIVLDSPGFLSRIFALTVHAKKSIRKEAFWTISNIAAGNSKQIQTILQVPEYMKILKEGLDAPADIATEAAWCWTNFLAGATREQVVKLVKEYQCLECLDIILSNPKSKVRAQAVDAAARTLSKLQGTQEFDEYLQRFKDQGLYDKIVSLPKKGEVSTHIAEFESYFDKSGSTKTFEKVDKEEGSSKKKINEKVAESESDSDEEEEEENHGDDDEEDEDEEDEDEKEEGEDGEDDENNPYLNPARED